MTEAPAIFFDGETAQQHHVRLGLDLVHNVLVIAGDTISDGRIHWPLSDLRALQDHADAGALTLTLASLQGGDRGEMPRLTVQDPALIEHLETICPDLHTRPKLTKTEKSHVVRNSLMAVGAVLLMVFVILPGIARILAEVIPVEREVAFGKLVRKQIEWVFSNAGAELPVCDAEDGLNALDRMVASLTKNQDIPYDLDVSVVDHELINAFALPGGQIVFFRGLIEVAESPDEVAAVLAHELGHVVHRDPMRESMRAAGSVGLLGLLFGDFAGGAFMTVLADSLLSANYSQAAEEKADAYAHAVLEQNSVSPSALGTFFGRLRDEYGDVDGVMAHLSTHPKLADRIEAAGHAVHEGTSYQHILDDRDWKALKTVCD